MRRILLVRIGADGEVVEPSLPRNLLFSEGDSCRINLATVQWFEGQIVAADKV